MKFITWSAFLLIVISVFFQVGAWAGSGDIDRLNTNVATADALSSNPSDCAANQYAKTIAANGDLTCEAIADAGVPDALTLTSITITQADLAVGSCTANQIRIDTGGATVELCICTATNTWSCAALATGPAN